MNSQMKKINGNTYWHNKNGQLHRDGDKPAVEWANGDKCWYKNGERHRDGDKPAVEMAHGNKYWYKNNRLHRDGDKPAIEWANGNQSFYKQGVQYTPTKKKKKKLQKPRTTHQTTAQLINSLAENLKSNPEYILNLLYIHGIMNDHTLKLIEKSISKTS